MDYREHITSDSKVMLGKPVIKGTRITVELVLTKLSQGATVTDLLQSYPNISNDDVLAVLMYAADVVSTEAFADVTE